MTHGVPGLVGDKTQLFFLAYFPDRVIPIFRVLSKVWWNTFCGFVDKLSEEPALTMLVRFASRLRGLRLVSR
jgi:hypothetical protein